MTEESTGVVVDDEEERHEFTNGAAFATTDGQLHVMDSGGELVAMFAAGAWRSAQIKH